ncbi:helix-turn-helix transcriptional regulator [Methylobacterium sp. WL6]|nr:helix-turn-helix transcriptional regulator [Methylobacterium sp. WL6]
MPRQPDPNVTDAANLQQVADRLVALGHVTRFRILVELGQAGPDGLAVGTLQDRLGIGPASTLSKHVANLVAAELMTQERRSTVLVCRASDAALATPRRDVCDILGS